MAISGQPRPFRSRRAVLRTGLRASALALVGASLARFTWSCQSFSMFAGTAAPSSTTRFANVRLARMPMASRGGETSDYEVGDKVKAMSPDDEQWYPGVLEKINDDGTYTVKWDDPDGGPETNDVDAESLKKIIIFKDYVVGDDVQAMPPDDGNYYPGVVTKVNADGTFTVKWDDPDGGPETHDVKPDAMKKVTVFKDYKVGDVVEAVFPEDGQMYGGTVSKVNDDGTFTVKWDDPDGGPEETPCKPKDMKYPPIPFDKLKVGDKYKGTVRSVTDFGAFVDIGAEADGLVHISRIANERVDNVRDYLEEEQEIDVWISGVRDDGKFGLTMVEGKTDGGGPRAPQDFGAFEGLSPDDWQTGKVARIAPFGAFVTVTLPEGASADGLVHISQIRDGFVDNVADELSEGQEVKVRVMSVDMDAGRMSLSMKEGFGGAPAAPRAPADLSAFEGMESKWLKGTVARIAPFGLFVTVKHPDSDAQADGLVHITQIRDGFVENTEDEAEVGQEVNVWIQSVDTFAGKMSLSMKQADGDGEGDD